MENGKNLWNAVDLLVRAESEIEGLLSEIKKKLESKCEDEGEELGLVANGENVELAHDSDEGWVRTAMLRQWSMKPKGKGKRNCVGFISVEVVLWSEDRENDLCGSIPRVEVAFKRGTERVASAVPWLTRDDDWEEWTASGGGKLLSSAPFLVADNGARWDAEHDYDWIFVIPLFSLNESSDIDRYIIDPIIGLLRGEAPSKLLKGTPAMKFSMEEGFPCVCG